MNILSISGSLKNVYENTDGIQHDSSAVLIVDGEIISAIEEERLNRIKHTDKFPSKAINFVLEQGGLTLANIDQVCYYGLNHFADSSGNESTKRLLQELLIREIGYKVEEEKLFFVYHHLGHAVSSYYMSGFEDSLVLTIDGQGDGISGMVMKADGKKLNMLRKFPIEDSLGIYYLKVIYALGYKQFDEYKVMGLAPYGDPAKYRDLFKTFYNLLPEGNYSINLEQVKKCYLLAPVRKKNEEFNQIHMDIAAALQESVEEIALHILTYYQEKFNSKNLCMAGGVAHNCSLNGKVLYSGLFENVFVQPASHDAGCAVGAGLYRYHMMNPSASFKKLDNLYWGRAIADNMEIEKILNSWSDFIEFEKKDNIAQHAANLIANDSVIGWSQGKSEFGPRALGNRSIVADPRPEKNKDLINEMVKKREGYRPFAPSVQEEYVHDYYDLPSENCQYPYMTFVQKVKADKQKLLGAVTHIDGTARIQTVSKSVNEKYWTLIDEFRKLTGVALVLNTSFNNNAEPIVDSEVDSIVCFLTTKLDFLIIGDFIIRKKNVQSSSYENLKLALPEHNILTQTKRFVATDKYEKTFLIKNNFDNGYASELSEACFNILNSCDGKSSLGELMEELGTESYGSRKDIVDEMCNLWAMRFVKLYCI